MKLLLVLPTLALGLSTLSSPPAAQHAGLAPASAARVVPARIDGTASPGLHNTGTSGGYLYVMGDFLLLRVSEGSEGVDLNGDGDLSDLVAHAYDPETGILLNTGCAVAGYQGGASGRHLAISVDESDQGATDLNGDGDTDDAVPHVVDFDTGAVTNLGIAEAGVLPLIVSGAQLVVGVSERENGRTDLNGDGDSDDTVQHHYSFASGELTNLGLAVARTGRFWVGEGLVYFEVSEVDQGRTDLNGDGDFVDDVGFVISDEGQPTSLGIAVAYSHGIRGGKVWMTVSERAQGEDLNGDDLLWGYVAVTYDLARRRLESLGKDVNAVAVDDAGDFAVLLGWAPENQPPISRILPSPYEAARDRIDTVNLAVGGQDYSGGAFGGPPDVVLNWSYHFLDTGVVSDDVWGAPEAGGKAVVFGVLEHYQGEDLNGDGLTDGVVLHQYDFETGSTTNLGQLTPPSLGSLPSVRGNMAALLISEDAQDLNGDGDTVDNVAHLYDASTQTFHNTGFAVSAPALSLGSLGLEGDYAAFVVPESDQGHDLNGDGDMLDSVPFVYDVIARRARSTGLSASGYARAGNVIAFAVGESAQGEDLNGDGDLSDSFVYVLTLPRKQARR